MSMADKLTLDVMAAKEAKMSYGQWMAMQYVPPSTTEETHKPYREPPIRCAFCGKLFERNKRRRVYCSSRCREMQHNKRSLERYHQKKWSVVNND